MTNPRPPIVENPDGTPAKKILPAIISLDDLFAEDLQEPEHLIDGVLHKGTKMILGGGSKSFKTWTLMELALALATGGDWLGFKCKQCKVLYINLEILPWFARKRFDDIKKATKLTKKTPNLHIWNLRGYAADIVELEAQLISMTSAGAYSMIIFDPIYKVQGNRDENSNGDIAEMLNGLERLAVETEAAVAFGHHFAKGNASGKYAIDRMSGAGAWARDPDTIITLTPHEEDECFVAEFILRNHAPIDSFVVRREHPLMIRDELLDASKLRQPGNQAKYSVEEMVDLLPTDDGLTWGQWKDLAEDQLGMSQNTFSRYLKKAVKKLARHSDLEQKYFRQ